VFVAPSWPRQQALRAANLPVPSPTSGIFLVDTGASTTVVDKSLIAPLGLAPTGAAMCHTPSTGQSAIRFDQYDVMLMVPGNAPGQVWLVEALPVMECDLSAQGILGLIGRDMLNKSLLVYNGPANEFTLAY
jgi:hypothetical protein